MDVTLEGWNHHNDPAMKKSDQPGGSLKVDGEFQKERMTENKRLHDLFQARVASKTPYLTKELLKDAQKLLELDLILLVGSDLTWNKTERGVAPRTDASQSQTSALIRAPTAASGGGVNDDEDSDEGSEDNDDDDNNADDDDGDEEPSGSFLDIFELDPLNPGVDWSKYEKEVPDGPGFAEFGYGHAIAIMFFYDPDYL